MSELMVKKHGEMVTKPKPARLTAAYFMITRNEYGAQKSKE